MNTGTQAQIQTIFSTEVLNYANPATVHIRDGIQTKQMRSYANLRNNSTATYCLDIYWIRPRFDANATVTKIVNNSMLNEGVTYRRSTTSIPENIPPNLNLFSLPGVTAHYVMRKKKKILRPGEKWSWVVKPRNLENTVRNSAIMVGNGTNYQKEHCVMCVIFVKGTLGHESLTGTTVISEVLGLDLEVTQVFQARIIKEPTTVGNRVAYANPITTFDVENTYVGVDSGARVAIVDDAPI